MTDEAEEKFPIPAFIRTMIEAHRRVDTHAMSSAKPSTKIEYTYLPAFSRPSDTALSAIGKVASTFAVLERVMGMTLARLALAPEYPTLALTKELSLDNQVKALRTLVDLHEQRYASEMMTRRMIDGLRDMAAEFAKLKDERNAVVHTVWIKSIPADGVRALPSKPSTAAKAAVTPATEKTTDQINDLARRIQVLADNLFVVTQLLPAVDEAPHVESLAQEADRLHSEIRSKRPDPPSPSEG